MAKHTNQLQVSVSKNSYVDEGNGLVSFPGGLTITDDSVQRNGTRYDIESFDESRYGKQLTADHVDSLGTLIGKVIGVAKQGNKVVVSAIQYASKESAYAKLAYDLFVGGFSNSFSIETMGPYPDDSDRIFYHAELVGLSQVVLPNNYNAVANKFNETVHNSLERSKSDGMDITGIEASIKNAVEEDSMTEEEKKKLAEETAKREAEEAEAKKKADDEAAEAAKNAETDEEKEAREKKEAEEAEAARLLEEEAKAKEEAEKATAAEALEAEAKKKAEEDAEAAKIADEAKAKADAENAAKAEADRLAKEKEEIEKKENQMTKEEIAAIVKNALESALKPVQDELASAKTELAQAKADAASALDAAAKAPEFHKAAEDEKMKNELDELSSEELFGKQLNAAVAVERMNSVEGMKTLTEINQRNLNALKEAKLVKNSLTLSDLGNFVIAPELYNEIATKRNDYTAILNATSWKETNSIDFGWLTRSSDIDMKAVPIGALDDNGDRLKPISTPGYGANTDRLEEMAAVTPISINVIKFAAADILSDVAEGYRNDYDRKRAQLVIARLQQAVQTNGKVQTLSIAAGLVSWAQTVALASDATSTGTLIFNNKTKAFLIGQAVATNNAAVLQEVSGGSIFGTPFITVPNDLLPTLNTNETRTFLVHAAPVTITYGVFYAQLDTFTGRMSGGLKYDVDGSASYEQGGQTFSAYQRNEVVLRGSFFRGGVIKDIRLVAAIAATAIS